MILMSNAASAATITYYLSATSGVNIGADGTTNVQTGTNVVIPPIITALLDTTGSDTTGNARSASHPTGLYTHSRWYFTSDYTQPTQIGANPSGSAYLRGGSTSDDVYVRLYDYDTSIGTKTLIGSSSVIHITSSTNTVAYPYTITSSAYIVPQNHRLMLQYDYSQTGSTSNARVYASQTSAYLTVVETPQAGLTYNLSGYVTNQSSGLPLSGASVTTNTSLNTTTNATGYYNFTGLSNATYLITANLNGYSSNSITRTISGANVTNANITLPPIPTYDLSGFVKNQSSSASISGATVTTNTSLTTTTDGTGYYKFTVGNGTYIITASKTGYSDNSTMKTVNGAAVGNANISLASTPVSTGQILVSTNRYVVLDDPLTSGKTAQTAAGFALPSGTSWSSNTWSGNQTQIKGYALVLDANGIPIRNTPVIFSVRNWDSLDKTISTAINTDTNGIASYSLDLNAKNYYGNWYVDANATAIGKNGSTGFIYNWFGCNAGGCRNHGSESPGTATPSRQNSPYTLGRETITANGNHNSITDTGCVGCHRGYGGVGGGNTFSGQSTKTADVHKTDTCATCHATIATHDTNEPIKSCTDCHSWANLTKENTTSGLLSNYSGMVAATGHNANNTIPCIICHGPMHNITKPDESLRFINNNITEDSHCLTCHTSYNKHNSSVGCTVCHSQDIHAIQVLSQNANYVNLNSANKGDCTNCHQNASFLTALLLQPKHGQYSGSAPQIPVPLNHSTDHAGTKWGTYWTSAKDACIYCHGDNKHIATRLGDAALPVGTDMIGGPIGTGTVCSSCHNPSDSDYLATMALLIPNPVANQPGTNWNVSGTDHASYGTTDADCKTCHGGVLSASPDINEFVHNVDAGKGGTDCIGCHTTQKGIYPGINFASFAKHKNVNTTDGSDTLTNNDCKTCHTDISNMYSPGFNVVTKTCIDCHNSSGTFAAPTISNHRPNGINISTPASCSTCHNNSINAYAYSADASSGHYGTRTNLISTKDCTNCHKSPANASTWGAAQDPALNATFPHSISNTPKEECYTCHNDISTSDFHNVSLSKPALSTVNCLDCHATTRTMAPKKIDSSVLSAGVHKNRACENCHTNATDTNMNTYSFSTDPAKTCTYCHTGIGNFGAPIIAEHNQVGQQIITPLATCNTCHDNSGMYLTNTGTNGTTSAITHYLKDVTNRSTAPYQHFGPINTSNCIDCHNGAYTNNTSWGTPVNITTSSKRQHTETQTSQCDTCHKDGNIPTLASVDFHNASLQMPTGGSCMGCHSTVGANLGLHSNLSGTAAVEDSDCQTCHFGSFSMVTGAANNSNTHYCQDCHTTSGTGPVKPTNPSLIKDGLSHGSADCKWCHAAGNQPAYKYHASGPRGTATGKDCVTCHYDANLVDEPFKAPGEIHSADITGCYYCHDQADNHIVTALSDTSSTTLQSVSVTTPITSGNPVLIQATVSNPMVKIAAAQYQVTNISGSVIPWTNMSPFDGRFDSGTEIVNASIGTSNLNGTYTVNIKGMASAPKTSGGPYYPLNGQWSAQSSNQLIVIQAKGYINGTVRNNSVNISGATVTTNTGVTAISDANGFYSLNLVDGTYQLTTSKEPEYYTNSSVSVTVMTPATVTKDIILNKKPIGTISGTVRIK